MLSLDPKKVALARQLYADRIMPVKEICETLHRRSVLEEVRCTGISSIKANID
jgi:hypothetical protein